MPKIRVLVADEETLFRKGVCAVLKLCGDIEIVGEATNGQEIIEMVQQQAPDIVVMNLVMPVVDGVEVTHWLRKESKDTKVLLLTQNENREWVLSGLRARANGYISKHARAQELIAAISAVYRGEYFLHPLIAKTMVEDYSQLTKRPGSSDSFERLTPREKEILRLLAEGRKCEEIAQLFDIEPRIVLSHRTTIMRKLGIHKETELIKYALDSQASGEPEVSHKKVTGRQKEW